MKIRSPAQATPRFIPCAALPTRPLVRGRWKCQSSRPAPASSAQHSFPLVTYNDPLNHDRCRFPAGCRAFEREDPLRRELANVLGRDLPKLAVTVSPDVAVVGGPVRLRGGF